MKRGIRMVHGDKELIRETRTQRSVPMRFREVVLRNVACCLANSMAQIAITMSVSAVAQQALAVDAPVIDGRVAEAQR